MANRSMTLTLSKIVSSVKQPDTGRTVTIRNFNNAVMATATETPANSGQYTATWDDASNQFYCWWYVDGVKKDAYGNNSPFWCGTWDSITGTSVFASTGMYAPLFFGGIGYHTTVIALGGVTAGSVSVGAGVVASSVSATTVSSDIIRFSDGTTQVSANSSLSSAFIHSLSSATATGTTVTTNVDDGDYFDIVLSASVTLSNPTNPIRGSKVVWVLRQPNAGGPHTVTLGTKFRFGSSITGFANSTVANKTDYLGAAYSHRDDKWDVLSISKGY